MAAITNEAALEFQVWSDLKLLSQKRSPDDFSNWEDEPVQAPYLLIPGNLGHLLLTKNIPRYRAFLIRQCGRYDRVFIVLGNIEHYGGPPAIQDGLEDALIAMRRLECNREMKGKLTFLQQGSYDFEHLGFKVTLLGATFWSRRRSDQGLQRDDETQLDRPIKGQGSGMTLFNNLNKRFQTDLQWLKDRVALIRRDESPVKDHTIIVMTHYAPCLNGTIDEADPAYWNEWSGHMTDILGGEGVEGLGAGDFWVFGNTPWSTEKRMQDEVHMFSNTRGGTQYENNPANGFDKLRVLRVPAEPVTYSSSSSDSGADGRMSESGSRSSSSVELFAQEIISHRGGKRSYEFLVRNDDDFTQETWEVAENLWGLTALNAYLAANPEIDVMSKTRTI
ncbi:unnamed protein product [Diplocarpon coronariae]|nr:hypothetical protein JHW43_007775 [Diplocarpon mali]